MVRKRVEGDEDQKRRAVHHAEREGHLASERGVSTGASKQRHHVADRNSFDHEQKLDPIHRGKQRVESEEIAAAREAGRPVPPPGRTFPDGEARDYGAEHERVFQALNDAQRRNGGEAVHAEEIIRTAGLPDERTRVLLHDLVAVHHMATELARTDFPDQGPRYETRPRW